jgi:hypothetical protein
MTGRRQPANVEDLRFREVDTFPPFESIEHGELFALRLSNNTATLTHGLHRFPAKFVPQVPAWALDTFGNRNSINLDPFVGSGTTLVEGVLRGGTSVGIDVDPFARFITRAKVSTADAERIKELGHVIAGKWHVSASMLRAPMPDIANFGHWFTPAQWGWLQSLHDTIIHLDCSDEERTFLLAIFSSVLRRVSNADDQTQKTYVSGTLPKDPPPVREVFWRLFVRGAEALADLNRKRHSEAITLIPDEGDATRLPLESSIIDLAVTSPPYLDSVDYPYNMMLEYFWLGPHIGVSDRKEFNQLRRRAIGAKTPADVSTLPRTLKDLIRLDIMPTARRAAATSYFALMERHFLEAARCLKPGARYVFVVGNSQSRSDVLPMHEALVKQAAEAGLHLEKAFGYRIRRHYMKFPRAGRGGIILIDWILVFRKSPASQALQPLPLPWVTLAPGAVAH